MNKTLKVALTVAVLVIATAGLFFPKGNTVVQQVLGVAAGPDVTERWSFQSGFSSGGRVATTTTAATYTTAASDFNGTPTYLDVLPNVNTAISLSSTSTFAYVPKIGDVAKIYIRNASTTAGATITLAAKDANLDLQKNEDTADLAIAGLDWAELTLVRESNYLVTVLFAEFTEAD